MRLPQGSRKSRNRRQHFTRPTTGPCAPPPCRSTTNPKCRPRRRAVCGLLQGDELIARSMKAAPCSCAQREFQTGDREGQRLLDVAYLERDVVHSDARARFVSAMTLHNALRLMWCRNAGRQSVPTWRSDKPTQKPGRAQRPAVQSRISCIESECQYRSGMRDHVDAVLFHPEPKPLARVPLSSLVFLIGAR